MRIDLIAQVLQLLLQVLFLKFVQPLLILALLEIQFDTHVHAQHHDEDETGHHVVLSEEERRRSLTLPMMMPPHVRPEIFFFRESPRRVIPVEALVRGLHGVEIVVPHGWTMLFHGRRLTLFLEIRAKRALQQRKTARQHGNRAEIEQTLLAIDKQRGQQEVVQQEGHKQIAHLSPQGYEFSPGETTVLCVMELYADHWHDEHEQPHHYIEYGLLVTTAKHPHFHGLTTATLPELSMPCRCASRCRAPWAGWPLQATGVRSDRK